MSQSLEAYAQLIVEFARNHEAWAPPIAFALAFGESLAFVSLLIPAWAALISIGVLIGAGHLNFWPIWIGWCDWSCPWGLALILGGHQSRSTHRSHLAAVAATKTIAKRRSIRTPIWRICDLRRSFSDHCEPRFHLLPAFSACLIGAFRLQIFLRLLFGRACF
jgi:hypothetical protein